MSKTREPTTTVHESNSPQHLHSRIHYPTSTSTESTTPFHRCLSCSCKLAPTHTHTHTHTHTRKQNQQKHHDQGAPGSEKVPTSTTTNDVGLLPQQLNRQKTATARGSQSPRHPNNLPVLFHRDMAQPRFTGANPAALGVQQTPPTAKAQERHATQGLAPIARQHLPHLAQAQPDRVLSLHVGIGGAGAGAGGVAAAGRVGGGRW